MDLGSGPARAFIEITLPIIAPALLSSWLLNFTLSLDDLVISSFVAGYGARLAHATPRRRLEVEVDLPEVLYVGEAGEIKVVLAAKSYARGITIDKDAQVSPRKIASGRWSIGRGTP